MQTENKALCNSTSFIPVTSAHFLVSGQWTHKNRPTVHIDNRPVSHTYGQIICYICQLIWSPYDDYEEWHQIHDDRFISCFSLRCYFLHTVKNWQLVDLKCLLYGLFRWCFYDLILKKTPYIMFHLLELILSQHNLLAKIGVWRFHSTFHFFFYLFSVRE